MSHIRRTLIQIRPYQSGDHTAIAEIFTAAVHEIAAADYTEEQCLAWADREVNYEHWKERAERKRPFIAVVGESGEIAGFLELDADGHIDCAYINPRYQRRGIMTQLVEHAVRTCFSPPMSEHVNRVYVEASICARPMFEKAGFSVIAEQQAEVRGVKLTNYRMERWRSGVMEAEMNRAGE